MSNWAEPGTYAKVFELCAYRMNGVQAVSPVLEHFGREKHASGQRQRSTVNAGVLRPVITNVVIGGRLHPRHMPCIAITEHLLDLHTWLTCDFHMESRGDVVVF